MLKKLTLLAMAVAALVAFAAPSMASGAEWKTNGILIGGQEAADMVHFTGTLSSTKGPLKVSCLATANAELWNEEGVGVGDVNNLALFADPELTKGCTVGVLVAGVYIDVPNCHVNAGAQGFKWPILTVKNTVEIKEVSFTNEFKGCEALGIPNGAKVTAEGEVTGAAVGACIVFNEAPHIPEVKIDGEVCATKGLLEL